MNVGDQHLLEDHGSDVFLKDHASQHKVNGFTNPCPEKENEETIIVPVKKSRKKVVAEKKEPGAVVEDVAADKGKLRKVQFGRDEETSDGGRVRKKANANKYTHEIALIMRGPSGDSK